jgi:hypothetical protein
MWLTNFCKRWLNSAAQGQRTTPQRRGGPRLRLERLEDRTLPSTYTADSVTELIADINDANKNGGANTIQLAASTAFVLTAVNNTTDGANGLPVITKGNLTITGNGATVEASTASGTPAFRLFDVGNSAALTLVNLTLENGFAYGSGTAAEGGAIYNQGTLVLNGVTVQNNAAQGIAGKDGRHGGNGQDAAGGAIWSAGSLTLGNGTVVQHNGAGGGWGGTAPGVGDLHPGDGGNGGNGFGGGVYVAGGTVNLSGVTLTGNIAAGGLPGQGIIYGQAGHGFGGGLYVAGGTVSLSSDTVTSNTADYPLWGSTGSGGGLYLAGGTVYLDAFTVTNTINNTATVAPNIYGPYILN